MCIYSLVNKEKLLLIRALAEDMLSKIWFSSVGPRHWGDVWIGARIQCSLPGCSTRRGWLLTLLFWVPCVQTCQVFLISKKLDIVVYIIVFTYHTSTPCFPGFLWFWPPSPMSQNSILTMPRTPNSPPLPAGSVSTLDLRLQPVNKQNRWNIQLQKLSFVLRPYRKYTG